MSDPVPPYHDDQLADAATSTAEMLRTLANRWKIRLQAGRLGSHPVAEVERLITSLETAAHAVEDGTPMPQRAARAPDHAGEPVPSGERFRMLIDSVGDHAIFMLDPDGRVATWNPGAERIKGYHAEEIIGRHFSVFYTREDLDAGKTVHELDIAERLGRYAEEGWRLRKNGERFWASVTITAVRDPATKQLVGFAKVTRDLTERRQAEELLRRSEERLRLLVESVKDYAIYMLDPDGRITTWNSGAEQIKGYRADEVLGRHFSLFYPPEEIVARRPERELEIAIAEGRHEAEGWRVRKNGERFWANVVLTAIHDPQTHELRGFAKVTRDLTDRRKMEEETRRAAAQAEAERERAVAAQTALQVRDEFISVAAHELRTPLTALQLKIQGVMLSLRRAQGEDALIKHGERLEAALRQTERLASLVERLLDVSRMMRGSLALVPEEIDLTALVATVLEDMREPALQAGSELRLVADDHVLGVWDRSRLEQVVLNLVSNAIQYGAGKLVEVAVKRTPAGARVEVTDRGIGIAEADLERIFARFERAVPLRHYGGMGLGLYVTKNIIEAHGGSIDVTSELGRGSTFRIDLPLHTAIADVPHPTNHHENRA